LLSSPHEPLEQHGHPEPGQRHLSLGVYDRVTGADRTAGMVVAGELDEDPGGHRPATS
jgi:hypothetical protein